MGCQAVWLYSNANVAKTDPKGLPVDLTLFHTTKSYGIGALAICVVVGLLYIVLW